MDKTDVIVSFRGVRKTYDGETLVVRHLDLDIYQGEFLTLLGPSGSGKTTCLMMLAGFEFPTGGEIRLDGQLLNNVPPHKRNIGMVFQNYALFPHLTVEQNVAYPLGVRKVPAAERAQRVNDALKMVRMEGFAKRYPAQLSGGQQQRIALARALVFQPKLVLMDEPLGALDKQLREHMQYELKSLHEKLGVTFVYVTHDQGEALTMSDRVAVFDKGIVQQIDTVDRLYETPCNEFVANFIGDSNRLRGTITSTDGEFCEVSLADGTRLVGRNVGGAQQGAAAIACIRPERMRLAAGAARGGSNTLAGEARGLIYFGDHVRMRCGLPQQDECFVKVPLGTDALDTFAPGQPVALEFAPEHLRVFA
ncbi:ABC transporter ATP-binding protein [Paraburkholderia caballeronis]|uniref:Spermidine/putrescine import ATP-binding protein PotA n=1 Tax=Paraburkholderia caballeronis TaxID=416943 RepID=A0A1H7VKF8_9BURK|nr:ABC transporter ATP-binding protein [Paraburkholderia caballeronis]PXW16013.1 putative spermidine/putrescine transport system ATP-binding protein [Paraburkholderia caballeronis]PXW93915.1 putative spermidine/putrescine transport system ATP-binding protein [Paraburkholderia caballeronis]RAJ89044.1 putative spermidine/putrescine transport system ATP-binding protein [Paraburkholderia caballeronis]TDV27730.1 putative spermidine/putrescine transport system ATP-binding protein [Paraburkholderia ca